MDDTDKLIAGMFAATMTAKLVAPTLTEFIAHYDACLQGMAGHKDAAKQAADQERMDEWTKGVE
jgi:choline-glycine betaine transporter